MHIPPLYPLICWWIDCFRILATVNYAPIKLGMHALFQIRVFFFFFLQTYPGVELLVHIVVLFSVSWEASTLFSTVAAPTYLPASNVRGFSLAHILTNTRHSCSFWWLPFRQAEGVPLWFWVASSWWLATFASFHLPLARLLLSFGKVSIQLFCPFLNQVFFCFFFYVELCGLCIFWLLIPYWSFHLQIFSLDFLLVL